jgi:hypothetical protein
VGLGWWLALLISLAIPPSPISDGMFVIIKGLLWQQCCMFVLAKDLRSGSPESMVYGKTLKQGRRLDGLAAFLFFGPFRIAILGKFSAMLRASRLPDGHNRGISDVDSCLPARRRAAPEKAHYLQPICAILPPC